MKSAIAIKSCHKYSERRQAQLDTWLTKVDIDFFFLVGGAFPDQHATDVLWCNASDDLVNIAPKVLYGIEYALEQNVTNLFVCDDDTYVVYQRLMTSCFEMFDYVGHMRTDDISYNRDIPYAQGSAFWLSERAMNIVVERKSIMRDGIIDDGALGQCLISKVPFTHDSRYEPGPYPMNYDSGTHEPTATNDIISCHKCSPPYMREIHKRVTSW